MAGIITPLTGILCAVLSGIVTFVLTKKKYNTEVEAQMIKNMGDSFDVYKKMMEENTALQNEKIAQLQKENDRLKQQVQQLQTQVFELMSKSLMGEKQQP